MLDTDLADFYQVSTMQLNQAVKRNSKRFPPDFLFKLTQEEKSEVITVCDNLRKLKFSPHLPYAFSEHGVAMLSAVLKSDRAVTMSIFIVRAFIKLREFLATHKDLAHKIEKLEEEQKKQGREIQVFHDIFKNLINPPEKPGKSFGFASPE